MTFPGIADDIHLVAVDERAEVLDGAIEVVVHEVNSRHRARVHFEVEARR